MNSAEIIPSVEARFGASARRTEGFEINDRIAFFVWAGVYVISVVAGLFLAWAVRRPLSCGARAGDEKLPRRTPPVASLNGGPWSLIFFH